MPVVGAEIPECLYTAVCPNCGYSLVGLPAPVVCPECGRPEDRSELVFHGWARGHHENVGNAKRSRVAWVLICSIVYMAGYLPDWRSHFFLISIIVVTTVVPMLYQLFRRGDTEHPGLVQIRLDERGCVQYDDLAGPSPLRDLFRAYAWLLILAGVVPLYYSWRLQWIGPIAFYIWSPLMVLFSIAGWSTTRDFRRALREVRERSVADSNAIYHKPLMWEKVKTHSLNPAKSEMYRLTITRHSTFSYADVDAEMSLSPEQAAALVGLLQNWIRSARAAPHAKQSGQMEPRQLTD